MDGDLERVDGRGEGDTRLDERVGFWIRTGGRDGDFERVECCAEERDRDLFDLDECGAFERTDDLSWDERSRA